VGQSILPKVNTDYIRQAQVLNIKEMETRKTKCITVSQNITS